jgi:hypothetical protein
METRTKKLKQGGLMDGSNYLLDLHTSPVANYLCLPPPQNISISESPMDGSHPLAGNQI